MCKYITDTVKNNLKSVIKDCSRPVRKAAEEVVRGLLTEGMPILRHLAQNEDITAKKQAEKYSRHLGKEDFTAAAEKLALRHAKAEMKQYTFIAYDLSDIAKECASAMEKIRRYLTEAEEKYATVTLSTG